MENYRNRKIIDMFKKNFNIVSKLFSKLFFKLTISINNIRFQLRESNLKPVSVCVPCYEMHGRGSELLSRLLDSLCEQTFRNFEVVISDQSRTTDDIKKCAQEYSEKIDIVYVKHAGASSSTNMNNAIRYASHEIIKPLFQDDFLINPHALHEVAQCKKGWGAASFVHTDQNQTHYFHKMVPRWNEHILGGINSIGCPSVIYFHRNDKTYFDEKLIWLMDCEFYHLLYCMYGLPNIIPSIHTCIRLWDNSVTKHVSESIKQQEKEYIGAKHGYKPIMYGNAISNNFSNYKKQVSISVDTIYHNDNAPFRVLLQLEPPEVLPITSDIIKYQHYYDLILAWNEDILSSCSNAVLFPFGTCWIKNYDVDIYQKKCTASFLTSSKKYTIGHQLRHEVFSKLPKKIGQVDIVKHKSPPRILDKAAIIKPYQYSIVIENSFISNWFTEKLIDCFITKTIPLYNGCPNLYEYFNVDGVFTFTTYSELEKIILSLTPKKYFEKIDAIEENFKKAFEYVNIWERVDKIIKERLN